MSDTTPDDNIGDAATTAHDATDRVVPDDKQDAVHETIGKATDAAHQATDAARHTKDAATAAAAPALKQGKSLYAKNPRAFQILGGVVAALILITAIRRARNS
jgi:hypothetical protein